MRICYNQKTQVGLLQHLNTRKHKLGCENILLSEEEEKLKCDTILPSENTSLAVQLEDTFWAMTTSYHQSKNLNIRKKQANI